MEQFHFYLPTSFLIAILILSCTSGGFVNDLKDMGKLRDSLTKVYPKQEITIKINNGYFISISFINSELKNKTKEEKEKIAEKVGAITKYFFIENRIKEGNLIFVVHKNYVVLNYTEGIDAYDLRISSDTLKKSDTLQNINSK